nr:TIR domain-containing protein [PVC group bacterium]
LPESERRPDAAWGSLLRVELGDLTDEAGAALLHHAGANRAGAAEIDPDDSELLAASRAVGGHALTLNLLGRFLARAHAGDVLRRNLVKFEEADREVQGGTTFKTLAAFENWFADEGEIEARSLAILRLLSLFDRPADLGCMDALRKPPVIPGLTQDLFTLKRGLRTGDTTEQPVSDRAWNAAVSFLADFGLLAIQTEASGTERMLDCHPLIREHFAKQLSEWHPDAWRSAHRCLLKHLESAAEPQPSTLDGLQPLYQAVGHGCKAGLYSEAKDILNLRIRRPNDTYSILKLGAFGDEIVALASFFSCPWEDFPEAVCNRDQAWLLNEAAFCLRALSRPREAIEALKLSFRMNIDGRNFANASVVAGNLGELFLSMGDMKSAVVEERLSVELAERSSDFASLTAYETALADVLHQSGRLPESESVFERVLERHRSLGLPQLIAQGNFRHCEFLLQGVECAAWRRWLSYGRNRQEQQPMPEELQRLCTDIQERAQFSTVRAVELQLSALGPALDCLTLGRVALYCSLLLSSEEHSVSERALANEKLEAAAIALRQVGQLEHVPRALMTRAWLRCLDGPSQNVDGAISDLHEALLIAGRGDMRLHMADIHLHRARLFFREGHYPWASPQADLAAAEKLINECGYRRRDAKLVDAKKAILGEETRLKRGREGMAHETKPTPDFLRWKRMSHAERARFGGSGPPNVPPNGPDDIGPTIDPVHFSAFAPPEVMPGSSFLVQIWAYLAKERREMEARAKAGGRFTEAGAKGPVRIQRGDDIVVVVEVAGFELTRSVDTIIWEGEIGNASFPVLAPDGIRAGTHLCTAEILTHGVPVAELCFQIEVGRKQQAARVLDTEQQPIRSAFASYAEEDRRDVLRWTQGAKGVGVDVFVDVLSLRGGQDWERELREHVPSKDRFFLFWSQHAKDSPWVRKEWECAFEARGCDYIHPVPLVDPRTVPPPKRLAECTHFEDLVRIVIEYERYVRAK